MYGYICPTCGAHLDPQERCEECTEQKLKDQRESERIKSLLSVGKDAQYELVLSYEDMNGVKSRTGYISGGNSV